MPASRVWGGFGSTNRHSRSFFSFALGSVVLHKIMLQLYFFWVCFSTESFCCFGIPVSLNSLGTGCNIFRVTNCKHDTCRLLHVLYVCVLCVCVCVCLCVCVCVHVCVERGSEEATFPGTHQQFNSHNIWIIIFSEENSNACQGKSITVGRYYGVYHLSSCTTGCIACWVWSQGKCCTPLHFIYTASQSHSCAIR